MKKKVLIVANLSMHIIKVRKSLILALEIAGYDVEIITARDKYFEILIDEGYKIHELYALDSQGKSVFEQFKIYFEYKKLYKKINPDFVFHYTIKPNIYGTLVASSLNIPSVITVNGIGQVYENPLLFKAVSYLYKRACKKAKAVIFQNDDDRNIFLSRNLVKKEKTFLFCISWQKNSLVNRHLEVIHPVRILDRHLDMSLSDTLSTSAACQCQ